MFVISYSGRSFFGIHIEGIGGSNSFGFGSSWQWLIYMEIAVALRKELPSQDCHDCGRRPVVLHFNESFVLHFFFISE